MNGSDERVLHLAEGFRSMVAGEARKWWLKLPMHTRVWVSLEDLMEQGMYWVMAFGVPRWDVQQSTLSTFLYCGLQNKFSDIIKKLKRQRRNDFRETSLEQLMAMERDEATGSLVQFVPTAARDLKSAENMVLDCFAVPMMMRVYRQASPLLKREIKQWFLPKDIERIRLDTLKFHKACWEFRRLAKTNGLAFTDCEHLVTSPSCLNALTFGLNNLSHRIGI